MVLNIDSIELVDAIEKKILKETRANPEVRGDPYWFPETVTVVDISFVLARSYMSKVLLHNTRKATIGDVENMAALILEQNRWLSKRGQGHPDEVPTVNQLRGWYCKAGGIIKDHEDSLMNNPETLVTKNVILANLKLGVCHMISQEFYGGDAALFHDK